MKQFVSYRKHSEMKILRTTHQIGLREGLQAIDLIESLKHVPATARIIEINEGDSEEGEYPYLEFEVEAEVVDPPKTPATRESTGADQNADQTKSNNAD